MIEPNLQEAYFQASGQPTIAGIKLLSDYLTRISAAESAIASLTSDLAAEVAALTARIDAADAAIAALQAENTTQQAEIDALEAKFVAIAAVTAPVGGTFVDTEARTAINDILAAA